VDVVVCVPDQQYQNHVAALINASGVDNGRISTKVIPFTVPYWRDYGPIFLKNIENGKKKIADFCFNMWGYYPIHDLQSRTHERIDRKVAAILNLPSEMSRVVSEGGDRLLNGQGTMIADEFCRFINDHTILLAHVSKNEADQNPIAAENRRRIEINCNILTAVKDQDGNSFKIERIPMPETLYFKADPTDETYATLLNDAHYTDSTGFPIGKPIWVVPATSYFNFLISNKVVLAQQYYDDYEWMPASVLAAIRLKDLAAVEKLRDLFPGRWVVPIKTVSLNFGGGGIHCATQQPW
jgi:agmatine/peptidylarginine deiminase